MNNHKGLYNAKHKKEFPFFFFAFHTRSILVTIQYILK